MREKMEAVNKKRVLFICTHNSARSQMAEGFMRALYGNLYDAYSAGTHPSAVNPYAIKVMNEIGIDISMQHSKSVDEFVGMEFDYVATVCDKARQVCPFFPGAKTYVHKGFEDPAEFRGTEAQIMATFRRLRDEIKDWIEKTFGEKDKDANEKA
jgi:arsenate reductase